MLVFLNGEFVAEERAVVSVFDRSFRYGDGLFEAVLARHGRLFRWPQHLARLQRSCEFLRLPLPLAETELTAAASELLQRNALRDAVVRLQISRGLGPRGYAPSGEERPCVVISAHALAAPSPEPWKLVTCPWRVPAGDALAQHKTSSRLLQVMAAMHAREHSADEALLLNTDGFITEGSTSNVFWIRGDTVGTPPLSAEVLPGVTRSAVLELCDALGVEHREDNMPLGDVSQCDGVFLTLTTRGVVEACSLDGLPLQKSPLANRLRGALDELIARECAAR